MMLMISIAVKLATSVKPDGGSGFGPFSGLYCCFLCLSVFVLDAASHQKLLKSQKSWNIMSQLKSKFTDQDQHMSSKLKEDQHMRLKLREQGHNCQEKRSELNEVKVKNGETKLLLENTVTMSLMVKEFWLRQDTCHQDVRLELRNTMIKTGLNTAKLIGRSTNIIKLKQ